jgi:O-antigen/teichoic acid export membrane protein
MSTLETIRSQFQQLRSILLSQTAKDSYVLVTGDLMVAAIGFISSIIVIRVLGPSDYGSLALSIAVMAATAHMLDLGIRTSAVRYISLYLKTDIRRSKIMLTIVFRFRLIAGLIALVVGLFLAEALAVKIFKKPELTNLLKLAFCGSFGAIMYDFVMTDLQASQRFRKLAGLGVVVTLTKTILIIFLVFIKSASLWKITLLYICTPFLGFGLGSLLISWEFLKIKDEKRENLKVLFQFSKWVMISYLLASIYNRAELFFLGHFKEASVVGIYSAAHTLVLPLTLVCASLAKILLPKVTSLTSVSNMREYFRISVKILIPLGIFMLPYYFLAPHIVILIGEKYMNSIPIFRILFFHALIIGLAAPIVIILYSLNKPHIITYVNCGQFCFSLLANYLVIPSFGAMGAAVVALCSYGTAAIVSIYFVIRYLNAENFVLNTDKVL